MTRPIFRPSRRQLLAGLGATALAAGTLGLPGGAGAADLKGGTLRVALTNDMTNYDPMQFSTVNFFLIKNLYDSLIEYTEKGEAVPSLATEWKIAADNTSVKVMLRDDVTFHSGTAFHSAAVDATLKKATDPERGKNVFSTMAIVKDWTADDAHSFTLNFKSPVPDKQITDLLQFLIPIDPAGIDSVETVPAGTGAFLLAGRKVGQSITMKRNPNYWRKDQPILDEMIFTVFSEDSAATSALESGSVDVIYGGQSRSAVRLRDAGYQVIAGPGKLVQVF